MVLVSSAVPLPLARYSLCLLTLLALWSGDAHALNRVTLRNGFTYDCTGQQVVDPTHTRLFLSTDPSSSYVDISTTEIAAIESLPTPPPSPTNRAYTQAPPPTSSPGIPSLLASAGSTHNIDVALLASIVHAESSGQPHAVSRAGARGLMQLMPGTARDLGVEDSFQPDQNINGGTAYLDALLTRYHDNLALTLAAYNAGPAAVDRYRGIPPYRETQNYVVRVMKEFKCRKQTFDKSF